VGPSFVSGQTREGITRTGRRCRLPLSHTLILDNGKYFELYDKWFGERGVVPYPMSDKVRNYMLMQSMPK
jgi:hypothetical protein